MTLTPDEFHAELLAALRPAPETSPVQSVQVEDDAGLHVMFYLPEGDDRYADGGTLFVPRAVLNG
ncbi:hypothetical protein [Actinacidiphila reveromycinica]|uniref:hypothetical protein n=1 Tax=Actinacidiphila reveromycinica TaxID=659352 RepID=UPI001920AECA|nr:hypothetical protein [Streptomyces sp. SN-593]